MLLNCGVGEDSWKSLGLQGDPKVHHPKGDQSWVFIGRTDVEAETPILWSPDAKSWLLWKDPDAGKAWGQEEMGMTEDEMAGWHHRLNGLGFGWTPGVGDGQGGSWGCKKLDTTERLNWTELTEYFPTRCWGEKLPEIHLSHSWPPDIVGDRQSWGREIVLFLLITTLWV